MLKKLQKRFVRIAFIAMALIVMMQFFAVNLINVVQHDRDSRNILDILVHNGEIADDDIPNFNSFFQAMNPFVDSALNNGTPYSARYFVVYISNDVIFNTIKKNVPDVPESEIVRMASIAYSGEEGYGFCNMYRYFYMTEKGTGISKIAFISYERELKETMKLAVASFLVGLALIGILIWPIMWLAKRAVRPVEISIEKQKQFITDASHELKTPIAIISANAEVLEICEGQNEWTTSIRNQTSRLNTLVKNLVTLSKLEENRNVPKAEWFSLSDTIYDVVLPFVTPAKTKGVEVNLDIQEGVMMNASETEIRQLISILSDNAVKYVKPNGEIKITCYKKGKNIYLNFYNDCENIDHDKLARLFDRFYRTDTSRNSTTGGHGVGLSIARVTVERAGGTIEAVSTKPESITFKMVF